MGAPPLVEACNDRPQDEDWGVGRASALWACYGRRPAHTRGPAGACHPDDLELCVVDRGHERVWAGRAALDGTAGKYSIVPAGVVHSSGTLGQASIGLTLHLSTRALEEAREELGAPRRALDAGLHTLPESLARALAALRAEILAPEPAAAMLDGIAMALAGELFALHRPGMRHRGAQGVAAAGLRRALDLMHATLDQPLALDDAAAAAGLSRFRFAHAFKQRHGVSPYSFHRRLRLQRAAEQVRVTDRPLASIALDMGFGTASRFAEAFHQAYGRTPSAWRRESRQQDPDSTLSGREA